MALDISKIKQYRLNNEQYFQEESPKTQIYIHHTASSSNPFRCIDYWNSNTERIATAFLIAGKPNKNDSFKDGDIVQAFASKHWAYHLGIKQAVFTAQQIPYKSLDKTSIGIEVCNWGQLSYSNGKYVTYVGTIVPESEVFVYETPYRGYKFYHKYTQAQINSLKELLLYLCEKFNISKRYNETIWDIDRNALRGTPGIYSHTSVRSDKNDMNPQSELTLMLKTLEFPTAI